MIKINLLSRGKKKKKPVPAFLIAGGVLFFLAVAATFYFNYFLRGRIAALALLENENEQKIELLKAKIEEVKNYEKLNKSFNERKQIIEDLRKNQALPVKVLDEISARLTDGIWLSGLDIVQNGIRMDGYGYTNDNVVSFVQNLKSSPFFTDVYLEGTSQSSQDGVDIYHFSLTMKVKT